jgi:hypothetical protein
MVRDHSGPALIELPCIRDLPRYRPFEAIRDHDAERMRAAPEALSGIGGAGRGGGAEEGWPITGFLENRSRSLGFPALGRAGYRHNAGSSRAETRNEVGPQVSRLGWRMVRDGWSESGLIHPRPSAANDLMEFADTDENRRAGSVEIERLALHIGLQMHADCHRARVREQMPIPVLDLRCLIAVQRRAEKRVGKHV